MRNGSLVTALGPSTTPLTRRGSPGPAPARIGMGSRQNVTHAVNNRDRVIGSASGARGPQVKCQASYSSLSEELREKRQLIQRQIESTASWTSFRHISARKIL